MEQKVIQIGNSIGVVIPQALQRGNLKAGDRVFIEVDPMSNSYIVNLKQDVKRPSLTPEFLQWLTAFNKKYKTALTELAKK